MAATTTPASSSPLSTSRIIQLAATISSSVAKLQEILDAAGRPSPSFDQDAPVAPLPREALAFQDAVLDATAELHDLLLEPIDLIFSHGAHNNMACLQAIGRFNIAALVPPGAAATTSFENIAAKTGLSLPMTRRLMRHAMTMRIFCEPQPGLVGHTQASRWLAVPHNSTWISTAGDEMWPAALKMIESVQTYPDSQEARHSGFSLANNTTQSIYDVIATDPPRAQRFATAMHAYADSPGFDAAHVLDHHDWASLGPAKVVDVGGSQGHIARALASRFPDLDITVQDFAPVIQGAEDALPLDLRPRVRFMAHNFFAPQPLRADVYYFRWIFHNWTDKYAVLILRGLASAMTPGARLLIQEIRMPEPGEIAHWKDKIYRAMDLNMAAVFNSHERTVSQWETLLAEADPRFQLRDVVSPPGSVLSLFDVRWNATE